MGYVAVTGDQEAIVASVSCCGNTARSGSAQWSWRQFVTGWIC